MPEKKTMQFANFNITFGETPNPKPMLTYLKEIIFPTFKNEYIRGDGGETQFYFSDVKIKFLHKEYILVGNLIKNTHYEIKTKIDDDKLIEAPSVVPTAPYSRFMILLKNHRMILLKNETRSPDIRSFQKTYRTFISKTLFSYNKGKPKEDRIPAPDVNIVDIPLPSAKIENELAKFEKISNLTLKLFPLNNDFDTSNMIKAVRGTMNLVGSKSSNIIINSPSISEGIKDVFENSNGIAKVFAKGKDKSGKKIKLSTDAFSSNSEFVYNGNVSEKNDDFIIRYAYNTATEIMNNTSASNLELYNGFVEEYSESDFN